eukprot:Tamp_30629.p1 GENE.Tamp_30629~~Tamp_30629.p1  ORF type:complete len:152 (-),score=24.60 Tamp_30629:271-672(-)
MDFFACCSNRMLDRDGKDAFAPGGDLSAEGRKEACEKQCGLGIAFKPDKRGNLFVKRLVPGGPADASKLIEAGDVLHAVDGKNVIGMNKMEVASLLMGPAGSKVRLRFLRQDATGNGSCYKDFTLERQPFEDT